MTAKAGEHRTIRLPEDLVKRIDTIRGTTPRERWIRALLYRVTGELVVGSKRRILLEFAPDGALLDGPRRSAPVETRHGLATVVAHAEAVAGLDKVVAPSPTIDAIADSPGDTALAAVVRGAREELAGITDPPGIALEASRRGERPSPMRDRAVELSRGPGAPGRPTWIDGGGERPRMRLKRPEAKP